MTDKELVEKLNATKLEGSSLSRIQKKTILAQGDVPKSEYGVFNPSICAISEYEALAIFRAEPADTTWKGHFLEDKAVPLLAKVSTLRGDLSLEDIRPIEAGMPRSCRPEDWRLFRHRDKTYVNFTNYYYFNKGWQQTTARSQTALGTIEDDRIAYIRDMDASDHLDMGREEKNWCFFSENDELFCVYSVEPFIVFHCDSTGRILGKRESPVGLPRLHHGFMANSTNPIEVSLGKYGQCYLMFTHQFCTPLGKVRNRTYYQHALVFEKFSHTPLAFTPMPIAGGGNAKGRHDGVVYFSGALEAGDNIIVVAGEGDSHSAQYIIPKQEILNNLQAL